MVDKANVQNIYPLSPMQEGMLFHALADGEGAYLLQSRLEITGLLDRDAFEKAWALLVKRHDVFRTLFSATGADRPLQIVLRDVLLAMTQEDISSHSPEEQQRRIETFCDEDQKKLFDLKTPPLLRLHLFALSSDRHVLIFTVHHLMMDGWCQGVLQEELLSSYYAFREGTSPTLPPPVPYASFIKKIESRNEAEGISFWRETLDEYQPVPLFNWKGSRDGFDFACLESSLDAELSSSLKMAATDLGVTLHVLFQSLWGQVAARFSGRDDIVFGTVVSGRSPDIYGSERIIGLCINTVPVRVRLRDNESFADLVRRMRAQITAAMPWQQMPLVEINALAGSGAELFDHLTVFENYPTGNDEPLTDGQIRIQPSGNLYGYTNYNLVAVFDPGDEIVMRLKYNSRAVGGEQVALLRDSFLLAAQAVACEVGANVSSLPILPDAEETRILRDFSEGISLVLTDETVVAMFEKQAEQTPERTAIVATDGSLTYAELNCRSNIIANRIIKEAKAACGECVGVVMDRDSWMHAVLIGVMKSGAAYVPIDPAYPDERIAFLVEDCDCKLVLTNNAHCERLMGITSATVIDVTARDEKENSDKPALTVSGDDLVYVIHTSGSTGKPKGVRVSHRALANFVQGFVREVHGIYDQPLQEAFVANYVFDASSRAFYPPLTRGDTVHVIDAEMRMDPQAFFRYLCSAGIQILDGTPSLCSMLLEGEGGEPELLHIVCGGEGLSAGMVQRIRRSSLAKAKITNVYGPTETTVDSTLYHVNPLLAEKFPVCPIGRPLANQRTYILDAKMKLLPVGAVGELFIGGLGVAQGYHNRPELTAEKFVSDPFRPGEIIYRTGDRVRWLESGDIEFLGRMDQQVKIRGFRIEPGEVETVMSQHPEVRACAVAVRQNAENENELHAFYSGKNPPAADELRLWLGKRLPSHLVPSRLVCLEHMPMTATGKIDRKSLPEIAAEPVTAQSHLQGATEEKLAGIWRHILGQDAGRDDDFFVLGGHSLKAVRLVSRVSKEFGKSLPMTLAYLAPTLRHMAELIERHDDAAQDKLCESVFVCNPNAEKTVFCFPPYGATSIVYTGLSQKLPEYRFVCINFKSPETFFAESEQILTEYGNSEPVLLLGYSGGGNLAFEIASRWEQKGNSVAKLILLDSYRRLSVSEIPDEVLRNEVAEIMNDPLLRSCLSTAEMRLKQAEAAFSYAKYISGYQEGERQISADIHIICSNDKTTETDVSIDRYGTTRSRSAWKDVTLCDFTIYEGQGSHDEMLWGQQLAGNTAILRKVLG
jgi:amino acid adenylation domain-containing protein